MLPLRTLILLLLSLSLGMTATLGLYKSSSSEDTPAPQAAVLDPTPVDPLEVEGVMEDDSPVAEPIVGQETDGLEESAGGNSPVDPQTVPSEPEANSPATDSLLVEEPDSDSPLVEDLIEDIPASDAADSSLADQPVADSPLVEDSPAGHAAADIPAPELLAEEALGHETPGQEAPTQGSPAEDTPAEEPAAGEGLAVEAPVADTQDDPIEGLPEVLEALEHLEALEQLEHLKELAPSMHLPVVEESSWGLSSIRNSFQAVNGYFDSLVEMVGGRDGVCQYRCRHGKEPVPRPGYQIPEPNGCSNSILGFQLDLGIPAMTRCCDQLDSCYDSCGSSKAHCDSKFRWCVHAICTDLKRSLGFVSQVQACESMADALHNTVGSLGCRSYMSSQREACYCEDEERDEL
ncbi:group XIIB secretory phospholipase A2-like protein [Hypomesus transpacificus]|uniref:group XIIB secretory phospholipase A2-like protein n=1 Tax=Hypomesus transpacificus TaxID=137520 RepID=UPI001F07B205|nr:group XIIB secretory phospholipase A2-like protein [Hypomesus transpacificus]